VPEVCPRHEAGGQAAFTGEDIREYYCAACDESVIERGGMAFWSIANEKRDPSKKDYRYATRQ
jgi:hypothetical protein